MANISALLEIIRTAHLGRDMRQALHDSIRDVNNDTETALGKSLTFATATRKLSLKAKNGSTLSEVEIPGGGSGGGSVNSVNNVQPDATGNVTVNLADINDVNLNSPESGQVLKYDGEKWINGSGGGGGGGTSDYTDLTNKPQINGVTLSGNKTSGDLNLQSATIINVKDYGAVGDGVTDDSTAIQSALDVGGIIFFPDGDYVIETTLVPTDYSTLLGNNRQTARLKAKGCDAINLSNHNMVSIMNLCISPHADNVGQYTAIDLNGCSRPSIKNVLIGKFNYGIYSHTGTNWDIYCEDVYFAEPNVGLYHPDLTSQLHVIMHKCYFYGGTTTRCIDLHSTRGEFYDCRFGCQNSRAVNITDLSKLLFIGCDFEADSVITMGTEPNNTMVHIGDGFYNFINCTFVGNDYFSAGYLMQLWYTNACQFNDCSWQGVAHQYKFNIANMGDNTLGNVYFNGLSFNPLYNYLKTNNSNIIKHIRNRYCTSQEYATRPNTANIEPYSIYHNINSNYLEFYDGTNWEILDHHT